MGRLIDFHLGYPSNLDSRRLQIFRKDAGGATLTSVYDETLAGSTTVVSTELAEGFQYQAKLTDARGADTFKPSVINFNTAGDASGGMPRAGQQSGDLRILHWEDTSSSSSTSTLSSSSSSLSSTSTLSSSSSSSTSSSLSSSSST